MKSIRYALVVTLVLAILLVVFGVLSAHAMGMYSRGEQLALGWRLALFVQNTLLSYMPFSPLPIGAAAIVGAWRSAAPTQNQRGVAVLVWLAIAVVVQVSTLLWAMSIVGLNERHAAIPFVMLFAVGLGVVADAAVLVLAVRVAWVALSSRHA
jgi:hypothetical protein